MSRELNKLSSLLAQLCSPGTEEKSHEVMSYLLNLMCKNVDLSPVGGKIIKHVALPYPALKKILCTYLVRYSSSESGLNVLATNSLLSDFSDPNPHIRKLIIKTTSSIPCLHDLALQLLPKALCDNSPCVRASAATSCPLVITKSNLESNQEVIDSLYEMIRDPEPTVVASALSALDEVLRTEGGIVINKRIAEYLMSRFYEFSEWDIVVVCNVLKKYEQKAPEEALRFMQLLDEKLRDSKCFIATDLALHFVAKHHENLSKDIITQFFELHKPSFYSLDAESLIAVLEILENYIDQYPEIFSKDYELFLCRFSDPAYIKTKKIVILEKLVNDDNSAVIIEEILSLCNDNTSEVSTQAVKSFITVLEMHPHLYGHMTTFIQMINIHHNNLSERVLRALSYVDINKLLEADKTALFGILKNFHRISSIDGKMALLRIIANCGTDIDEAPYILQHLSTNISCTDDDIFHTMLLSTSMRLFLCRPAEMQLLMGQLLQSMKNSNNMFWQKQSLIYYQLLKNLKFAQVAFSTNKK